MTAAIAFFAAILCFSSVYAQDRIDPPVLPVNFNDTTVFDRSFKSFVRGWNWGGAAQGLDRAMDMNCYHMQFWPSVSRNNPSYTDSNLFGRNTRRIVAMVNMNNQFLIGGRPDTSQRINGQSVLYKPTLTVDTSLLFMPRPHDREGAVFGFKAKSKGVILDTSQHASGDYDCFILRKDSITTTPAIVLDSVWIDDQFRFYNHNVKTMSAGFNHTNGRLWYLTLNVKLKDTVPDALLNETIFTVKMPYQRVHIDTAANPDTYTYFNSTVRFDSISSATAVDITDSLGNYRGKRKTFDAINDTVIAITGAMLRHPWLPPASSGDDFTAFRNDRTGAALPLFSR